MASEKAILRVLDLLTVATQAKVETLGLEATPQAKSMRKIVGTKNIVAVGISEKIKKGKGTGKLSLTFYVEKKVPLSKLKADKLIPPTVPESLSGPEAIPTDVVVIGKIVPEINVTVPRSPARSPPSCSPPRSKCSPWCGVSRASSCRPPGSRSPIPGS
jgi:hypothetical protein